MEGGISLALALALALDLTACSAGGDDTRSTGSPSSAVESPAAGTGVPSAPETATTASLSADKEAMEPEIPYDPQYIAILGMASLGIPDALGVARGYVVSFADTSLGYLQSCVTGENVTNLGTIKAADLEMVMAAQPDVIFINGHLVKSYNALSEITPMVYLTTDSELGAVESVRQNATTIASVLSLEDKVDELTASFDTRIQTLADFAADKTVIMGMCTSGGFNVLGNDDRCSIIGREIGFKNVGVDADIDTSTHGNEASFEFVVGKNPDYIFIMDRDATIQTDGAQLTQEIMKNELVMGADVYKNDDIVYLAHSAVWYTARGGIITLDIMLQDLGSKLLD